MMLTILLVLVSSVVSQSVLRTQLSANVRRPAAVSHGRVQDIRAFSSRLNGGFRESAPSYVNGAAVSADLRGQGISDQTSGYPQPSFSRRTLAGMLAAGALTAPLVDPKHSWAAGSDIKLASFGKDADTTVTKHIWNYMGGAGDPIAKDGTFEFKGGLFKGANLKVADLPGTKEKIGVGNIDGKGYPDVSSCEGIAITANSINIIPVPQVSGLTGALTGFEDVVIPEYKGYSLSIGKVGVKLDGGYNAKFNAPLNTFGTVKIPFKDFTNKKGELPDPKFLENMKSMTFFAEPGTGFKLKVQDVSAYGCTAAPKVAELATSDEAGGTSSLWLLTAASSGFIALLLVQIRTRPAPVTPPLLG